MLQIPLLIGGIGMQEVLLIGLVVLLFFGGRKIPELMKGLGKGVRSFKDGMNGKMDETDSQSPRNSPRWANKILNPLPENSAFSGL